MWSVLKCLGTWAAFIMVIAFKILKVFTLFHHKLQHSRFKPAGWNSMRISVLVVIASALLIPILKYKSDLDDIVRPSKHGDHIYDSGEMVGNFNWSFCCAAIHPLFGSVQSNGRDAPRSTYPAEGLDFFPAPMASEPHLKDLNVSETWIGLFNVGGATKGENSCLTFAIEFHTDLNDFPVYHWSEAHDFLVYHWSEAHDLYYRGMDDNVTVNPAGHPSAIDNCNLQVYPRACLVVMDDNHGRVSSCSAYDVYNPDTDVFVGLSAASNVGDNPAIGPFILAEFVADFIIKPRLTPFIIEPILHGGDRNFSKYIPKLHVAVSWKISAKNHYSLHMVAFSWKFPFLLAISSILVVVFWVVRRIINIISRSRSRSMQTVDNQTVSGDIELVVNCNHPREYHREYHYDELSAATNNFREDLKLGEGGFGSVYKGILQDTSEIVAVKKISAGSRQGSKEYLSEITILGQLRHRSLVPLLGWCHEKASKLLLVYKFMSKGSLEKYLFGSPTVDWNMRYKIAEDIASALVYLHDEVEEQVVHRDIKSSNIMLNADMQAKLGDFGLARIIEQGHSSHFTTPAGTPGYLAPECVVTGKATAESDVFSFGVVALEIACGRPAVDRTLEDYNSLLLEWVWDLYEKNRLLDAADKKLNGEFDEKEMKQLMMVGLWCSNLDFTQRPKIRQVFQTLKFESPLPCLPPKMPPHTIEFDVIDPDPARGNTIVGGLCVATITL